MQVRSPTSSNTLQAVDESLLKEIFAKLSLRAGPGIYPLLILVPAAFWRSLAAAFALQVAYAAIEQQELIETKLQEPDGVR